MECAGDGTLCHHDRVTSADVHTEVTSYLSDEGCRVLEGSYQVTVVSGHRMSETEQFGLTVIRQVSCCQNRSS